MKNLSLRISAILMACVLLLTFTACGGGGGEESTPDSGNSTTTTTTGDAGDSTTPSGGDGTTTSGTDGGDTTATGGESSTTTTGKTTAATTVPSITPPSDKVDTPDSAPKYKTFKNDTGSVMAKIDTVKGEKITLLCVDYGQFDEGGSAYTYLKKYYGISVDQHRTTNDNIPTEFTTAYLSGTPYDLVTDTQIFPQYVVQNVIEPLTNRIDFTIPEVAKHKPVFDAHVYGGDNYFLPWETSAMALIYYNIEVFEDANLDLNGDGKKGDTPYSLFQSGDWTWENFKKAAKQTNRVDKNGKTLVYGLLARTWTDSKLVYISGQGLTKEKGGRPISNLNNSDFQRIYNDYVNLINNDKVVKRGDDAIYSVFNSGGGAMLLGPGYMTKGDYFSTIFGDQNVGLAPIPKDDNSKTHYVPGQAYGFWVTRGGFHRNGKFNVDLLNAFVNGIVLSSADKSKTSSEVYKTARTQFVEKWKKENRRFTDKWYDEYTELQYELSDGTVPFVDPYTECMNIAQVLDVMTGWGDQPPNTFSAAVNMFEGQLKTVLDELAEG